MGFKVTVHKNGVKHGESHYTSEAVAVGMAKKMKNAGASVSVARCNGSGCGCSGTKANPRRRARGDSSAALEQKIAMLEATLPKSAVRTALDECGWSGPMLAPTRSEMESYLRELRRRVRANPRRNGTTSANIAASRFLALRNGGRDPFAAVRRATEKEVARYASEGGTFATQRLMNAAYRVYDKHLTETGEQLPVEVVTAEIRDALARAESLRSGQLRQEMHGLKAAKREAERDLFPKHNRRRNPSMTEAQANTLIRQLGGVGKLTAMIGASGFARGMTDGHPSLSFKFKGSKVANVVTIILDPSDTYTLRFMKMAGPTKGYATKSAGEASGVYASQLKAVFTQHTGLYLSL